MQPGLFSTFSKVLYAPCKSKDHSGELLSLACVDKAFQSQRLMCPICEYTNYPNQTLIVPLRVILSNIYKAESQSDVDGSNLLDVAMFLDRAHLDSLRGIQKFEENVAIQMCQLKETINKFYNDVKEQLKQYVQKQVPLHEMLDYFFSTPQLHIQEQETQKMERYLDQFTQSYQFTETGDVVKLNIYQGVLNSCSSKFQDLTEKLTEFQKEIEKRSEIIKDLYQPFQIEPTVIASTIQSISFKFSNLMKGANISVTNGNLIAEQKGSESNGQRFIICEPSIPKFGKTYFAFKVKKYQGWVGVGVCHNSIIQTASYKFNYTNIGHGSYLVSNNGYSWSHLQTALNSSHKSFDFGVGDTIYIEIDYNNKTITWKKNDTQNKFSMQIDTSKELNPCANLCSPGDIVELVAVNDIKF